MPLAGWVCPAGTPTAGQRNEGYEHCVSATGCRHKCVSPPLLISMWNAEHANHHKGSYLSASSLSSFGCARQTYFERIYDFYETPRRRFWPFRGTVIHGLVEHGGAEAAKHGWMQELRMSVPIHYRDLPAPTFDEHGVWTGDFDSNEHLVITLGGTTDGYNMLTRELHDFKTLSDLKVQSFLNGKDGGQWSRTIKDAWVWQTNIYAWLVSRTPVEAVRDKLEAAGLAVPTTQYLPKPDTIRMQLISMMEIPLTGTTYVPLRSNDTYDVDGVPVLPDHEVEEFIRARALDWFRWLVLRVKPPVVEKKLDWMCKTCTFNGEAIFGERCMPNSERKAAA